MASNMNFSSVQQRLASLLKTEEAAPSHGPPTMMDTSPDYPRTSQGGITANVVDQAPSSSSTDAGHQSTDHGDHGQSSTPVDAVFPQSVPVENAGANAQSSFRFDTSHLRASGASGVAGLSSGHLPGHFPTNEPGIPLAPDHNHSGTVDDIDPNTGTPRIFLARPRQPPFLFLGEAASTVPRKRTAVEDHATKVKVVEPQHIGELEKQLKRSLEDEQRKLSDSQKRVANLQKQLERSKNEIQAQRSKCEQLERDIAGQKKDTKALETTVNTQQTDLSVALTKVRDQEKMFKTVERQLSDAQQSNQQLQSNFEAAVQQRGEQLFATISTLEASIDNLKQESSGAINTLRAELTTANARIRSLTESQSTLATAPGTIAQLNEQLQSAQNEITSLTQSFENRRKAWEDEAKQKINGVHNNYRTLEAGMKKEIADLRKFNEDKSKEAQQFHQQQERNTTEHDQLKKSYEASEANLRAELTNLQQQFGQSQHRLNHLEELEPKHADAKAALETALEHQQEKNRILEARIASVMKNGETTSGDPNAFRTLESRKEAARQRLIGLNKRNGASIHSRISQRGQSMPPSNPPPPTRPMRDEDEEMEVRALVQDSTPDIPERGTRTQVLPSDDENMDGQTSEPISTPSAQVQQHRIPGTFPARYSTTPLSSTQRYFSRAVSNSASRPSATEGYFSRGPPPSPSPQVSNPSVPPTFEVNPPGLFRQKNQLAAYQARHAARAAAQEGTTASVASQPPHEVPRPSASADPLPPPNTPGVLNPSPSVPQSSDITERLLNCMETMTASVNGLREDLSNNRRVPQTQTKPKSFVSPFKDRSSVRPRTADRTVLTTAVRKFLRECLGLEENHEDRLIFFDISDSHIADDLDVERFETGRRGPPEMIPFQVYFDKINTVWNYHMAKLFSAALVETKSSLRGQEDDIGKCFIQRLTTLKDHMSNSMQQPHESEGECIDRLSQEFDRSQKEKRVRRRQTKLCETRISNCEYAGKPQHSRTVATVGDDGMSSDESDENDSGVRIVKICPWRNPRLLNPMTTADSCLPKRNAYGGKRPGGQPDVRVRPRQGQPVSTRPAPSRRPSNYYHPVWFASKTELELELLEPQDPEPFPGEDDEVDPNIYT